MLQFNRATYRGHGLKMCMSGFKSVFAATDDLRPVKTCNTMYTMEQPEHKSYLLQKALANMDTVPISGKLSDFAPVKVELVSGSDWEPLWDQLVKRHHYLGYQKLLGHRIKYFAFLENHGFSF